MIVYVCVGVCVLITRSQNAAQSHDKMIGNKSKENATKLRVSGTDSNRSNIICNHELKTIKIQLIYSVQIS